MKNLPISLQAFACILLALLLNVRSQGQTVPCNTAAPVTYILNETGPNEIWIPDASTRPWKGGDTLKIPAKTYSLIEISNFTGDPCKKIVIINTGGQVVTTTWRMRFDTRYFKVTGTGTPGIDYGFKINGGMMAISVAHHFEVDHVEATGGSLGFYFKAVPDLTQPKTVYTIGSSTNYVMTDIYLHHNYFHDIHGEAMYIGHTGPSGGQEGTGLIPIRLDNVEISYNTVMGSDWDGIQLSNARNSRIHHNSVWDYGRLNVSSQQTGIIMGGNTTGDIYNNTVSKGTGNGIEVFGYGTVRLYNNTLDSCGRDMSATGQESIFTDDYITTPELNPKQQIFFNNNVVKNPTTRGAIRVAGYNNNSFPASVTDNQYCIPSPPSNWLSAYIIVNPTGSTISNNILGCGSIVPPPSNVFPVSNAGPDKNITLPVNSVTLTGSGTDADGTITSYAWTKISGPAATISSPSAASTLLTGLVQGVYIFQLQVTDNAGAINTDQVQVTVNAAVITNQLPVANAGSDITITLPASNATLTGTGTDPDGSIISYQWTLYYGPNYAVISNSSAATTNISGLIQGTYQLDLTVTDNSGATNTDRMQIIVNAGVANIAPTANAGADTTITLPVNSLSVTGIGVDPDGTISAYLWTKISGPASGNMANTTSATMDLSGLVQGSYVYQLQVTDNLGAVNTDQVLVTVNTAGVTNQLPVANAGVDVTITLPVNNATLIGTGTDPDGSIISYQWSLFSGPNTALISNANAATASIIGLVQGTYQVDLRVTDNSGATSTDRMQVIVNPAIINIPPIANAGIDNTITLPVNTVSLTGSGTDADGTVSGYNWTQITGPAQSVITTPATATTTINSLIQGIYKFELKVTDNGGASGRDTVQVTVNNAVIIPSGPKIIKVNINSGTNYNNTQWNNWNTTSSFTSAMFKYDDASTSSINAILNSQAQVIDNGISYATTATNPPGEVLRFNSASTSTRLLTIKGLVPSKRYNLEFYASRTNSNKNKTIFSVGSIKDTVNTDNNLNDVAYLNNIGSDASGNVVVTIARIGNWNYIAGFTITEQSAISRSNEIPAIMNGALGNISVPANDSIEVLPAVFTNSLKVVIKESSIENYSIAITDLSGNIIWNRSSAKSAEQITELIDTKFLNTGEYIVKVVTQKGVSLFPVSKKIAAIPLD